MNGLVKIDFQSIVEYMPEHRPMIDIIKQGIPEMVRASSLFGKTQSQFMDNLLTVSKPTPIRNLRQILAEMNKTRSALFESYYKTRKKEVEIRRDRKNFETIENEFDKEILSIEIEEKINQLEESKKYISGAIRKLVNYQVQYDSILKSMNISNYSEIDFEKEEERYHIMTAFEQGLNAARARHGVIDEGNMIYFTQLGINGSVAQYEVSKYLQAENEIFVKGMEPAYEMQIKFLNVMAEKFKRCSVKLAEHKGMTTFTKSAALERGDVRLLGGE